MSRVLASFALAGVLVAASVSLSGQQPQPAQPRPAAPAAVPRNDPSQQPPVTFRVEVDYVEVDASVTDSAGNPIKDLRKEDFEVFEDGKPQKIDVFTYVDLPIERADRPLYAESPIEPDVQSNERPFDGRLYVFLLDDMHTLAQRSGLVRRAVRTFIERNFGANDLAAVIHSSGRTDASQDFTSNKRLLLASVDKFVGRKIDQSRTLARLEEEQRTRGFRQQNDRVLDPYDQERAYNARAAMDTLKNVSEFLNGIRGRRKSILFFSEGIDYDTYDWVNNPNSSIVLDSLRDAFGAASRSNVNIYGIDPRGLTGLGDEMIEMSSPFPEDPTLNINISTLQAELRYAQDSLRILSDETGGFAVVNTNDFKDAFSRIVTENSSYYLIGYYPGNDRRNGRFRKIDVKVKRPGVEVRSRKGYQAPRGRPKAVETAGGAATAALNDALNSPLQESGLAMAVQATPFRGAGANASVLVSLHVEGRRLKFTEQAGQFDDKVEVLVQAIDQDGKVKGSDRHTVDLKLKPQTHQLVSNNGFRMLSRLEVPPGRYKLRVAGRSLGSGATGSVHYDLEVPAFAKLPLSMSGLVLSSPTASFVPTIRPDEQLKAVLPGPPATQRDFVAAETLALFAEVYDNEIAKPHKVDITTTLRADDGRVAFKHEDTRGSEELQGLRGGYGYTTQVPLTDVAPGFYVLRVEAKSRLSGNEPAAFRETRIRVWPRPGATPSAAAPAPAAPRVVPVARGPRGGSDSYREVVARNEADWTALWTSLALNRPQPKVVFDNTMIVGVFVGSKPTAGYSVEILGVKTEGDTLVVEYVERAPAPGVSVAQVVTTPYAVAGVPMHAGPVKFVKVDAAK